MTTRPLPGQRGLPDVAPDVPEEDSWEAAFADPPPTRTVIGIIIENVRQEEVEAHMIRWAEELGATICVINATVK